MKGNSIVLPLLVLLFICSFITWGAYQSARPQKIDPSRDSIQMVQPCGWFWCANYDQQYAEHVNKPNSEANLNNGQANLYNAQADQIQSQTAMRNNEMVLGGLPFWCGTLVILLLIAALGFRKQ